MSKQKRPEAGAEGTDEQEVDDERPLQRLLLLTFMLFLICVCVGVCVRVDAHVFRYLRKPERYHMVWSWSYECLSGAGPLQEQYAL